MFKNIILFISVCLAFPFQSQKTEDIIVRYAAFSCTCAQWEIVNSNPKQYIYLERGNDTIEDADKIWDGETLPLKLIVTGKFKQGIGLPKGISPKGDPKPGKVFKYDKIKRAR